MVAMIGIVMLVVAAALIIIGGLAALKKLPGNSVIGLRLAELRKSKEAWDNAHAVAGPFWALSGLSLLFGGIVTLSAQGWMWLIPVISVIVSVVILSIGSNMGARASHLFEQQEEKGPKVDLNALRNAARSADQG